MFKFNTPDKFSANPMKIDWKSLIGHLTASLIWLQFSYSYKLEIEYPRKVLYSVLSDKITIKSLYFLVVQQNNF